MSILWLSILLTPAADAAGPIFTLHTASEGVATGPLRDVGKDWSITLGPGQGKTVEGKNVIALRRAATALPDFPRVEQIITVNADRLPGTVVRIQQDRVHFQPRFGEREMVVPLTALAVLWLSQRLDSEQAELLRSRWLADKRTRDVILLHNGDVLEGTVLGLTPPPAEAGPEKAMLLVDVENKEIKVERDKVAAIALSSELARTPQPRGPYARLVLDDSTRLSLVSAQLAGAVLKGQTLWGAGIQVPLAQIVAIDICQGRAVYLSELKPKAFEHTPYLGMTWPFTRDGSVAGQELRVGGSVHDRGLGMHSRSSITFALAGNYRRFETLVGLDDRTGRGGNVRIQVRVDGMPRDIGNAELTWRTGPRWISVDVSGGEALTLEVDYGRGGDVQDHVNWADARLIR